MYRMSKKNGPVTKYDTISPSLKINENRARDIDSDVHVHVDSRYKNGIDRSRNV